MDAREYKRDHMVILELRDRVDEFNTAVLAEELVTILNTGKKFIAIDLTKTEFLSAHCLAAIWKCAKKARSQSGDIVILGASGQVLETIHYVNFDNVVQRFYSVNEALDHTKLQSLKQKKFLDEKNLSSIKMESNWFLSKFIKRFFNFVTLILFSYYSDLRAENIASLGSYQKNVYTLEEVLALAREASPQVKLARLRMIEKDAEVRIAKSFGLPKIMGTGGYLYQSNPTIISEAFNKEINNIRNETEELNPEQPRTRTKVQMDKDAVLIGLGFSQVVYSGGVFKNQIQLKEAQRNEAESQIAIESINIEEQVRNLFIGLMLQKEKLSLLKARSLASLQRMTAVQKAREARTVNAIQVAEMEVQSLKAEQELLAANREETSIRGLLNIGLGRPTEEELIPEAAALPADYDLQNADHYFEIALHRYPELKRSMSTMDSAAAYLRIIDAQSMLSPQALVFGSAEYTQGLGNISKDLSWSLGFGIVIPLYDGHKSSAEFEKATSLSRQARIAYEESERKLRIEISEVVSHIQQARLQRQLAKKSVEIAKARHKEAENAVREGQLPQYRLGESLTSEIEAKIFAISADAELYKWHARLLLITGQKEL